MNPQRSPLLTAKEAAEYLRISVFTLRGWTSKGRFPAVKVGRRALYRRDDLERVAREGLEALKVGRVPAKKRVQT